MNMEMEVNKIGRSLFGLSSKQVQERIMDMDVVYRNDLAKVQLKLAAAEEKIEGYNKQLEQAAEKERYLMQAIMRSEKEGDTIRQKAIEESQEIMSKALVFADSMKTFEADAEKIVLSLKQQVDTVNSQFKRHFDELEHLTGVKALPKVDLDVDDLINPNGNVRDEIKMDFNTDPVQDIDMKEAQPTNIIQDELSAQPSDFEDRRRSAGTSQSDDSNDYIDMDYINKINTQDIMDELFNKY